LKLLVLNNKSETLEQLLGFLEDRGLSYHVKTPMEPLSLQNYQGVIISGGVLPGGRYREMLEWYRRLLNSTLLPTLAICLGLRILGYCYGSRMRRLEKAEKGVVTLRFFREFPLTPGRKELTVYEDHDYELLSLLEPLENHASSPTSKIQAVKHKAKPLFGVQFHPEVAAGNEGSIVLENFVKLCSERQPSPGGS